MLGQLLIILLTLHIVRVKDYGTSSLHFGFLKNSVIEIEIVTSKMKRYIIVKSCSHPPLLDPTVAKLEQKTPFK